jgi:hypothetical protein
VGTAIHPDCPVLLIVAVVLVNRDELMRDLVSFLPDSHLAGSAIDIFHHVHLAFMFRK